MPQIERMASSPLKRFLVRANCEYSLEVEAGDADEAVSKADDIDVAEWSQAWAPIEVEAEE